MMYVEFMKNFFLADSSELMGVRVISASYSIRANCWVLESFRSPDPKTFDCQFLDMMYVATMKNFFSPIRANWWVLESFRPPEPKNVWFLLDFYSIRANWWVLESFRPPEPKNVWFPLSRRDVRRVYKKIFLADSSELMGVRVISASWA